MKTYYDKLLLIAIVLTLCMGSACPERKPTRSAGATPPSAPAKLPTAISNAESNAVLALVALDKKFAALQAEYDALKQSAAVASAQVGSANIANTNQPPSPATRVVDLETKLAMTNLPPADVREALEAAKRRMALLEGRTAEAEALYKTAQTESDRMKAEQTKLKADTEAARQEAEAQRQKAAAAQAALVKAQVEQAAELEKNRAANQANLDAANARADAEIKKAHEAWNQRMVWLCVGIGGLCILVGVGMLIATSGTSLWRSGLAFGCGAVCFGLAKLLSHPMFTTYFTIGCVLIVTAVGIFLWRERLRTRAQKDLAAEKEAQAEKLCLADTTLKHVVQAVEEVREAHPDANKLLTERLDYYTSTESTRPEYVRRKSLCA